MDFDFQTATELFFAYVTLYGIVVYLLLYLEYRDRLYRNPKPPKILPRLSVIIPAFNEESNIARTIDSVLESGYPAKKLEIIVVDDGSTDGTLGIAKRYERKGVVVIHKQNSGKAASLNVGIRRASGDYIATLDSDSYIQKGTIQKMLGYFSDPEVGAVTSAIMVSEAGNAIQKFQSAEYLLSITSRKMLTFLNALSVTPGPLSIFRRKIFDKVGLYDETNITEDQEMALRIQKHNYKIESCMDAVVYTRVPSDFSSLMRQRVRWYRGGVRNIFKYSSLVSPKYGDFGIFVLPSTILSVFIVLTLLTFLVTSAIQTDLLTDFLNSGFDAIAFSISGSQILTATIFIVTGIWVYLGIKTIRKEVVTPAYLIIYIMIYAWFVILIWIASLIKEFKLEKMRW